MRRATEARTVRAREARRRTSAGTTTDSGRLMMRTVDRERRAIATAEASSMGRTIRRRTARTHFA
jgi:hypothetical protein